MIWYGECCQNLLQFVRRCLAWCRSASDRVAATRRSTSRRPTWPSPSPAAQLVPLTAAPRWWSAAAATATSCWTPINTKVRKAALTHTIHRTNVTAHTMVKCATPLSDVICLWFDFWFRHYVYSLLVYIVCFPNLSFFIHFFLTYLLPYLSFSFTIDALCFQAGEGKWTILHKRA